MLARYDAPAMELAQTEAVSALPKPRPSLESKPLNKNEELVLDLFARGTSRSDIAHALGLSGNTIGHLLTSAKEKLAARTLPHAVMLHVTRKLQRNSGI